MIVEDRTEQLLGCDKVQFDKVAQEAARIHDSFMPYTLDWTADAPMYMDNQANLCFKAQGRQNAKKTDVTRYALSQAANTWGIPSRYIVDLYDKDMGALAVKNINELNKYNAEHNRNMHGKILVSEGVSEAVVSERFALNFPVCDILDTIRNTVDLDRYVPNQAYLSKSKFHMRFVDFENKEKVNGEDMSVGFTVDSSDVGRSSLKVRFFIYKFSCRNGIVVVGKSNRGGRMAGTLYCQKHLGEAFDSESIDRFKASFDDVELLRQKGLDMIANAQTRMMSEGEMQRILETARKNNCPMSDKTRDNIINLAEERYGRTKWGLINGITEEAQKFSLDDRIAYETWGGNLLQMAI